MKHTKTLFIIITIILVLGSTLTASSPIAASTAPVHPLLLQMAAEKPDDTVAVIIQKLGDGHGLDVLVTRLGGRITQDLRIINAVAVEMPAKSVLKLSRNSAIRWISPDAAVKKSGETVPYDPIKDEDLWNVNASSFAGGRVSSTTSNIGMESPKFSGNTSGISKSFPINLFPFTLRAFRVWASGITGRGIGVAVVDSGITPNEDLNPVVSLSFNSSITTTNDYYGHGTHVAGIIAGAGNLSTSHYRGLAKDVNIYNLKVNDESGMAYESDVVAALQWIFDHKNEFNIRAVNISMNSTLEQSYNVSPLDAACEILWFNGVVVVVSAGNRTPDMAYSTINAAPANDPFVITVGASNENGTYVRYDDTMASFSAFGTTQDGYAKPEILAPGKDIISILASTSPWNINHPERVVGVNYFIASGTSMAAPMVTAAVALLLQSESNLNPDQVKYRLTHACSYIRTNDTLYPYLHLYRAIFEWRTTETSNTGLPVSQLLFTGEDPLQWGSVGWNSIGWNSVGWNSVGWNSTYWGTAP